MAADIELHTQKERFPDGNRPGTGNAQPPIASSADPLPPKPPASYVPYPQQQQQQSPSPLHPQQLPRRVDFQTPPEDNTSNENANSQRPSWLASMFGNRRREQRPRWLVIAVCFRVGLLLSSLCFLALVIVLAAAFHIFAWAYLVSAVASLAADLGGASLPLWPYERRRSVAIWHTVLDGLAIAMLAIAQYPQVQDIPYGYLYDSSYSSGPSSPVRDVANATSLYSLCLIGFRVISMIITFGTSFYDTNKHGWWSPVRPLSAGPIPIEAGPMPFVYRVQTPSETEPAFTVK